MKQLLRGAPFVALNGVRRLLGLPHLRRVSAPALGTPATVPEAGQKTSPGARSFTS